MTHDVFLSYSSKDKAVADAACNVLERNHIRVWMAPRDILPGIGWAESIIGAINGARAMVLVFSSGANTSPQIEREVERAISKGIPVIPFRIENVEPTRALEYFISAPHWLDAFAPPMEEHLERLAEVVKLVLESEFGREAPREGRRAPSSENAPEEAEAPRRAKAAPRGQVEPAASRRAEPESVRPEPAPTTASGEEASQRMEPTRAVPSSDAGPVEGLPRPHHIGGAALIAAAALAAVVSIPVVVWFWRGGLGRMAEFRSETPSVATGVPVASPPVVAMQPAFCSLSEEYDKVLRSEGVHAVRAYVQRCGANGVYRQEAARELESRLFLAASECIRRASGCAYDGCLSIYESELPDGPRASALRVQAAAMAANKSVCAPNPPNAPPTAGGQPQAVESEPEPLQRPDWCARTAGNNPNEILICSDPQLARLDSRINELFQTQLGSMSGTRRDDFVEAAKAWIVRRDRQCGGASRSERESCLLAAMRDRIASLQESSSEKPLADQSAQHIKTEPEQFKKPDWCATARGSNPNETLICSDAQLARLDNRINELFQAQLGSLSGKRRKDLIEAGKAWIVKRDHRCAGASRSERRSCLSAAMQDRITSLRGF